MHGSDKLVLVVASASLSLIGIIIICLTLGYGKGDPTSGFGIGLWCGIPVLLAGITGLIAGTSTKETTYKSQWGACFSGLSSVASAAGCCLFCCTQGCCVAVGATIIIVMTMGSGGLSVLTAGVLLGAYGTLTKRRHPAPNITPLPNQTATIITFTTVPAPVPPTANTPVDFDANSGPPPAYSSIFPDSACGVKSEEQPKPQPTLQLPTN